MQFSANLSSRHPSALLAAGLMLLAGCEPTVEVSTDPLGAEAGRIKNGGSIIKFIDGDSDPTTTRINSIEIDRPDQERSLVTLDDRNSEMEIRDNDGNSVEVSRLGAERYQVTTTTWSGSRRISETKILQAPQRSGPRLSTRNSGIVPPANLRPTTVSARVSACGSGPDLDAINRVRLHLQYSSQPTYIPMRRAGTGAYTASVDLRWLFNHRRDTLEARQQMHNAGTAVCSAIGAASGGLSTLCTAMSFDNPTIANACAVATGPVMGSLCAPLQILGLEIEQRAADLQSIDGSFTASTQVFYTSLNGEERSVRSEVQRFVPGGAALTLRSDIPCEDSKLSGTAQISGRVFNTDCNQNVPVRGSAEITAVLGDSPRVEAIVQRRFGPTCFTHNDRATFSGPLTRQSDGSYRAFFDVSNDPTTISISAAPNGSSASVLVEQQHSFCDGNGVCNNGSISGSGSLAQN